MTAVFSYVGFMVLGAAGVKTLTLGVFAETIFAVVVLMKKFDGDEDTGRIVVGILAAIVGDRTVVGDRMVVGDRDVE